MLRAEIDDLKLKLEHMNEILVNMQRARFGQSSEKQEYVSPDQFSVFNEAEAEQDPKAPEPDEKTIIVPEHKRKPKRPLADRMAELPSEDVILELPEDERKCHSLRLLGAYAQGMARRDAKGRDDAELQSGGWLQLLQQAVCSGEKMENSNKRREVEKQTVQG